MTDEFVTEAERALAEHGAFEREDGAFALSTTPFEATVDVSDAGGAVAYRVWVRVPALNAVVEGEEVAPVVREGWFETFERRLEDAGGVTRADPTLASVERDRDGEAVVVRMEFETSVPARGADDAKALANYVEGTYMEGVIPGYDYREPVAGLLDRARGRSR